MYDLVIIGGGPGGYVAAIRGAQEGLKVLLVEKESLGGTCLNRGCIPTKSFIQDTKLYKMAKSSSVLSGIESLKLDMEKLVDKKRKTVKTLVKGLESIVKSNNIELIIGTGELVRPGCIHVHFDNGSKCEYLTRKTVLATGSRPSVPSFIKPDGTYVQTTDNVLDSDYLPSKVIIIGGGVIGIEMATIYLNAGCEVAILELLPELLMTEDKDIRREMRKLLDNINAKVFVNVKTDEVVREGDIVRVSIETQSGERQDIIGDRVLVATGRSPLLDGIDSPQLGLEIKAGFVKVDKFFQTNLPDTYAIGDLVGGMMLAHKASSEAEIVIDHILGQNKGMKNGLIPRCIWGLTEIGAIGLTEEEARNSGHKVKIGKFLNIGNGASHTKGASHGFVKIIGDEESGEILGVHIIGERATDLISEAATTIAMEGCVEDLYQSIKPHPTMSESVMEAAMAWNNIAIHVPKK